MLPVGENSDCIAANADRGTDRYRPVRGNLQRPVAAGRFKPDPVLIGYPTGKYGPLTRKPVAEVTYADTWGTAWPAPSIGE